MRIEFTTVRMTLLEAASTSVGDQLVVVDFAEMQAGIGLQRGIFPSNGFMRAIKTTGCRALQGPVAVDTSPSPNFLRGRLARALSSAHTRP